MGANRKIKYGVRISLFKHISLYQLYIHSFNLTYTFYDLSLDSQMKKLWKFICLNSLMGQQKVVACTEYEMRAIIGQNIIDGL